MDTFAPGFTELDTLYELKGFQIAAAFHHALAVLAIGVLVGFGILQALYEAADKNRYRRLVVYLVQVILVWFFLVPIEVPVTLPHDWAGSKDLEGMIEDALGKKDLRPAIKASRFLIWTHAAIDGVQRLMIGAVHKSFAKEPFAADRAVVLLRHARIRDELLRMRYHAFVVSCYVPVLADRRLLGMKPPALLYDPLQLSDGSFDSIKLPDLSGAGIQLPTWMSEGTSCAVAAKGLLGDLAQHLEYHLTQQETRAALESVVGRMGKTSAAASEVLRKYIVYNETMGLLETHEIRRLMGAIPEYTIIDPSTQSASNAQDGIDFFRTVVSSLVKIKQSVDQWIDHHAEGPAIHYKIVCYAPYVYGLSTMIFVALFPLAGFIALLPGRWSALFTWMKYLLWVKLWVVFWAVLSSFNEWRYALDDVGSNPENGFGDQSYIFPAIAAMYLLTPGLALVVVNLLTAGARSIGNVIGGGMAPSGGGQGPDIWSKLPTPSPGQSGGENQASGGGEAQSNGGMECGDSGGGEPGGSAPSAPSVPPV